VKEFVSDTSNLPYLLGFMTPGQRQEFAAAVESNDGTTVGKMLTDQTLALVGTISTVGGAAKATSLTATVLRDAAAARKAAETARTIARQLNNFYRDGAPSNLIQKTFDQAAVSSTHNAGSQEVVLGRYIADSSESYDAIARSRGATYFSVSDWSAVQGQLGADQMWNINKAFLDQQISQGKTFVFTANPAAASTNSYTYLEYDHLLRSGYQIEPTSGGLYRAVKK
jgi:filamentous hemagglutinin